jgi:choice-of-anchor C domain-containing protein
VNDKLVRRLSWGAGLTLGLLPMSALAASIVANGSFEDGLSNIGKFTTITSGLTNWTISSGNVDYIGSYWLASNGSRSLDLNGSSIPTPTVSQAVSLTGGQQYLLSFDMAGNPDGGPLTKSLTVAVGTALPSQSVTFDSTGKTTTAMGWITKSFLFTAPSTGSYALSFKSDVTDPCCYGPALDNVSISAVPEAETYAMMLAGLGLVGIATRRRTRAIA